MTPAVSVVVATFNYGRFLSTALDSALGQTFGDLEVIVIDDGSTDATEAVVAPYLSDSRLRYERTEHLGQPAAKNVGIGLARAPLLAFLDADDVWLPTKLEQQIQLFEADTALGVAYSRRLLIDEWGRDLEYEQPVLHRGNVLEQLFRDNFVCFSSSVIRRQVFEQVGLFDTTLALAIDYDLWLRVALRYPFDFIDEPLVKYRTGHASLSRRTEERLTTVNRIIARFLDEYGGREELPPAVVRRARAETYYHMALEQRGRSRLAALPWLVRCLMLSPGYVLAWKGLATLPMPESWRRRLRIALGRPADWTVRQPVGAPLR
jgi:glycosyltransferase involved in cell wall biosynthesis